MNLDRVIDCRIVEHGPLVSTSSLPGTINPTLHEGLIEGAIKAVDAGATHTLVERLVDAAMESNPVWVIQARLRQAEPVMNEGKEQCHEAAVRWLGKARTAYLVTGREKEGRAYLEQLWHCRGASTGWCRC